MQTINELKEIYRVWYAYLIYCPEFQEYIRLTSHGDMALESLPEEIATIGGYHDWIYALLPLDDDLPCMGDFTHVWRRFQRCYNERHITSHRSRWHGPEVNTNVIQEIVGGLTKHLPAILDDYKSERQTQEGTIERILNKVYVGTESSPVIQIPRLYVYPKRNALKQIEKLLEPYPDLREDIPQMGAWLSEDEPVRFKAPTVDYDSKRRIDNLNTYKRDLTWYALLNTGASYANLFYGNAIEDFEDDLPFHEEGINFTGHDFEKEISVRLKTGKTETPEIVLREYRYSTRNSKEKMKIKKFTEWAQHCKENAEKTMAAVAQGWFPKIPIERK